MRRLALLIIVALALTACSGATSQPAPDANAPAPTRSIVVAIGGESEEGYDPLLGWGRYGSPLFQSTLLKRDSQLNLVHDLATDVQVSDDGRTWTVTIRPDARFSDGSAVTASDVAFTFLTAAGTAGLAPDLSALEAAEAPDDHTVVFRLRGAQSTFRQRLATIGIVPQTLYGPDYATKPVGSGPYQLVEWQQGQQLIVEANPYYYGGPLDIERITFLFLNEDAAMNAARAGQVDLVVAPRAQVDQTIEGMERQVVPAVEYFGVGFPMVPDDGSATADGYPIGNDVTADPAIRRAIAYAMDRDALVRGVLAGYGAPAFGPAHNSPWHNPAVEFADADPETAAAELAEAGWELVDGVLTKGDLEARLTLLAPAGSALREGLALAVADAVKPLGIQVTVETRTWDDVQRLMHANPVLFGWGSHDPTELYNLFHSSYVGQGWYNAGFYSNPAVDAHLDAALAAPDEAAALAAWQQAQWDGEAGVAQQGDAAWAWLVSVDHVYFRDTCLDLGEPQTGPHGHGWPITANVEQWTWICP